ncbi:MAG: spore cortex-lytic enzyme [Clostridiales bacterium]|nr:spore cortex-lytic enzyme [Clostridiales bacterium]
MKRAAKTTVSKAFKNFYIFLIVFSVLAAAAAAGFTAYSLFYKESAEYATSRYGSTGSEVEEIQKKLKSLGYYNGSVDGIFGSSTREAVKSFQKSVGLTADGIAGYATLLYLGLDTSSAAGTSNNTQYSDSDIELLAKVISAEARGESYEGQVAVGAVILNRVAHPSFPDSISGVVYQAGAFSCVYDSNWYEAVSETSKKAAIDAINGWDPTGGAIYYFNAAKTDDAFMHARPVTTVIGNHKFCT